MAEHNDFKRTLRELLPKLLEATRLGALNWHYADHYKGNGGTYGYWVAFGKNTRLFIMSATPYCYLGVDLVIRDPDSFSGDGWRKVVDETVGNDHPERESGSDEWDGSNLLQAVKNQVDGLQDRLGQAAAAMDRMAETRRPKIRRVG